MGGILVSGERSGGCRRIEETLGHFALVSYIPNPLAAFLDALRIELTPNARPRAHVTILPPRPHENDLEETIRDLNLHTGGVTPFRVEMGQIEIFAESHVVFLGFSQGATELTEMYRELNSGSLEYIENFPYHPHVTLAQNIEAEQAPKLAAIATVRWRDYVGPREFVVGHLSFVRHVEPHVWVDVASIPLAG